MSLTNSLTTPFDFELTTLNYITSSGQTVDLRLIFTDLNLFQDIFSNIMSGNVTVTDSTNIFAYLVQSGNEFLQIALDKPGLNQPINKTFRVYNRQITPMSPSNQAIKLSFCSEEMLVSKSLSFSKRYDGMLVSDMVTDIVNNVLKNSKPINVIESTNTIQSLTVPYYTPFQAINWLASQATSSYVGATYMFYEDNNGYNFQSIQKMMDSNVVATYNYSTKNIADDNSNLDFFDVSSYEIVKTPNTLESLTTGRNSSRLLTLDLLRQKFTVGDLNGQDLFNSSVTLGNAPAYNNFQNRLKDQSSDSYGAHRKFYPTNIGRNQSSYIQSKGIPNHPTGVENWLLERNAQIMQLMGNRIKVVIPGNNMLNAGQVIQYNMPSIEPQTGTTDGSIERKLDPYMTGLWLITALRHRVTVRTFETVLELSRDSIQQAYPGAQNQNSSLLGYA